MLTSTHKLLLPSPECTLTPLIHAIRHDSNLWPAHPDDQVQISSCRNDIGHRYRGRTFILQSSRKLHTSKTQVHVLVLRSTECMTHPKGAASMTSLLCPRFWRVDGTDGCSALCKIKCIAVNQRIWIVLSRRVRASLMWFRRGYFKRVIYIFFRQIDRAV